MVLGAWKLIREKNNAHRHLIGKAKEVRRMSAIGLKTDVVAALQSLGNIVGGRREQPQSGIMTGVIVKAADKLTDDTRSLQALECGCHRCSAAAIKKIGWRNTQPFP